MRHKDFYRKRLQWSWCYKICGIQYCVLDHTCTPIPRKAESHETDVRDLFRLTKTDAVRAMPSSVTPSTSTARETRKEAERTLLNVKTVGVTRLELACPPPNHSRCASQSQIAPYAPCFGGFGGVKTPHRGVFCLPTLGPDLVRDGKRSQRTSLRFRP